MGTYAVLHGGREVTVGTADVEALLEVDASSTSTRKTQKYHSSQYQHRGQRNLPDRREKRKRSAGAPDAPAGGEGDVVDIEPLALDAVPGEDGDELDGVHARCGEGVREELLAERGLVRGRVEVDDGVIELHLVFCLQGREGCERSSCSS